MSVHPSQRIIGTFEGDVNGVLLVVIGALHGNEPAGVKALEMVFDALEQAKLEQPGFQFKGKLMGILGNRQAFLNRQRFLDQDLNRCWTNAYIDSARAVPTAELEGEQLEVLELFDLISSLLKEDSWQQVVFLDLHTTSAEGGLFSIPTDEGKSLTLAQHLGAPAIMGLQASVEGTLLGFAQGGGFSPAEKHLPQPVCVAFESGQHDSQQAIFRAACAVLRCMRAVGNLGSHDLVDFMETIALPILTTVPPVVQFRYAHHINENDAFKMRPGYVNFQSIRQGEHLADDVNGPVRAPESGLILMPLYQAKGSDGFFIVR